MTAAESRTVCPSCRGTGEYRFPSRVPTSVANRPRVAPTPTIWLSVHEVARVLGVSKMTVYRLVHGGEIDARRIGRSIRITKAALDRYLSGTTVVDLEAEE